MQSVIEILARVAEVERRVAGMVRHGTVAEIDTVKGRVRLKLGASTSGGDFLSPWVPYAQHAGALKAHVPPSIGQQFSLIAPSGDWRQAVAIPLTWSGANPAPSGAQDQNIITYGDVRIVLSSSKVALTVGGVEFNITGGGVSITGGSVTHNGKNIGSTHAHGGVMPGVGVSTGPV